MSSSAVWPAYHVCYPVFLFLPAVTVLQYGTVLPCIPVIRTLRRTCRLDGPPKSTGSAYKTPTHPRSSQARSQHTPTFSLQESGLSHSTCLPAQKEVDHPFHTSAPLSSCPP
ncbi:hypothetical protein B0T16DRAFT_244675 [Cercophora newfieldiana]|uniref:Uncharacterized protein n=1 Tax=Cercophora newfieldiana TaxID=92897 RepID=A0AA39XSR9_9PEZI|nr:hypothetical protein B0T16DRAFT_244675 [Cercophora newfieldiana]